MPFIRIRIRTILLCSLCASFFLLLVLTLNQRKPVHRRKPLQPPDPNSSGSNTNDEEEGSPSGGDHKLCVLVPFRDRFDELMTFVPHIAKFLQDQQVDHSIYVINQVDTFRFNRASLVNAGYLFAKNDNPQCDYVALHDVDLLPDNPGLHYSYPQEGPFHISPPGLHPKYDYPNFIGGIILLTNIDFEKLNGMSNNYWGWGLEDDEFFARIKDAGLTISHPENILTGQKTFRHYHTGNRRSRDYQNCYNQRDVTRRRDRVTGLDSVRFEVKQVKRLSVDGHVMSLVDVGLECNRARTPWCDCRDAPATEAPLGPLDAKDNIMPHLPKKNKGKRT